MPKPFLDCIKNKGHVITKTMSKGRYMKICFLNGKSFPGEVMVKGQKAPATDKQGG